METASRQAASTIDPKLLTRVAKGDQQAFGQLYDQSSTLLFTLAYRILSDREEAAELLQEVYLEVWRKIAKYDVGRGSPIAWLVTLTRSRAIDRLRTRTSRGNHVVADSFEHPLVSQTPDASPNPYETQEDQELRQMIVKAILDLPLPQQQAIEMAFYQGLTHTEIAAKLNQPLGTVKTRIKLAMTKLRASLHQTLPQGDGV
ncbi:MAG: RNA polymerase ECF-type sigma factor [Nitrospira sp.]|jgi:RNA polymerase sigma-70 factor (ECF subfamily)|nr:MAG: RNA polymerase ECF-type sigma factor [Nitrospira sp.]